MNSTFYRLLDNTMAEVCRREPSYISSLPLSAFPDGTAAAYAQHPLCNQLPPDAMEQALVEGLGYIARTWAQGAPARSGEDPVSRFLWDCIVDALLADQGLLTLQPHSGFSGAIGDVLEQEYSLRRTAAGVGYYIRHRGTRPLLLINATGTPIAIWKQFLADPSHEFKIILPLRRGSDLLRGGLQQHVDIRTDSVLISKKCGLT